MTNIYTINVFRFFFLLLLQGLVLQYIGYENIHVFIYPVFVMLLPFELPHGLLVLLAFLLGISIDTFYNGFGLHASVLLLLAFARPLICGLLEPRGGYELGMKPNKNNLGFRWFLRYSSIICFFHMFFIVLFEELSISWFILARVIFGFLFSMIFILFYQFIFNPKL
jgi:hypothetical protein